MAHSSALISIKLFAKIFIEVRSMWLHKQPSVRPYRQPSFRPYRDLPCKTGSKKGPYRGLLLGILLEAHVTIQIFTKFRFLQNFEKVGTQVMRTTGNALQFTLQMRPTHNYRARPYHRFLNLFTASFLVSLFMLTSSAKFGVFPTPKPLSFSGSKSGSIVDAFGGCRSCC